MSSPVPVRLRDRADGVPTTGRTRRSAPTGPTGGRQTKRPVPAADITICHKDGPLTRGTTLFGVRYPRSPARHHEPSPAIGGPCRPALSCCTLRRRLQGRFRACPPSGFHHPGSLSAWQRAYCSPSTSCAPTITSGRPCGQSGRRSSSAGSSASPRITPVASGPGGASPAGAYQIARMPARPAPSTSNG